MNQRRLELALKKQRLQMQAATQRLQMAQQLQVFAPVFDTLQSVQRVGAWARGHSQWLIVAGVALLVIRPKATVRWLRRGFLAWQMVRRARIALQAMIPL